MGFPALLGTTMTAANSGGGFLGALGGISGVGDLFGGIGQAVSGIFGGRKKRGPSPEDILSMQRRSIFNNMRSTVEAARENGISPIYALGAGSGFSAPISLDGGGEAESWGNRLADMGQGISRAASAYKPAHMRAAESMMTKLQLERGQLENDKLRAEIALLHQPGNPPGPPGSLQAVLGQGNAGHPVGMAPATPRFIPLINHDGTVTRVTSPDAGDNEFLMGYDFATTTLPDEFKNLSRRTVKHLSDMAWRAGRRINPRLFR